jgi:hypothetical protein
MDGLMATFGKQARVTLRLKLTPAAFFIVIGVWDERLEKVRNLGVSIGFPVATLRLLDAVRLLCDQGVPSGGG